MLNNKHKNRKKMKNKLKRKIKLWLRRTFDPKQSAKVSKEERNLMILISHLLKDKNSELLMIPDMSKFYIRSYDKTLFITIDFNSNEAVAVNHVFGYNIKLSQRVVVYIYKKFTHEVEIRRMDMENEYRGNIQNSLHTVLDRYLKTLAENGTAKKSNNQ